MIKGNCVIEQKTKMIIINYTLNQTLSCFFTSHYMTILLFMPHRPNYIFVSLFYVVDGHMYEECSYSFNARQKIVSSDFTLHRNTTTLILHSLIPLFLLTTIKCIPLVWLSTCSVWCCIVLSLYNSSRKTQKQLYWYLSTRVFVMLFTYVTFYIQTMLLPCYL